MLLRSIDVLHDFYVPEFRAKMDMIPGSVTYFWFTPTRTGTFEVLCAELCGTGHAFMRGMVMVDTRGRLSGLARRAADIRATDARRSRRAWRTRSALTARGGDGRRELDGKVRSDRPCRTSEEAFRWSMSHPARPMPSRRPKSPEVELYHPHSWWTKYVFSQDAKVIAIQYSGTAIAIGMVALVLSWLMRLQLGFPGTFAFITPEAYYQFITMHGMIMVIYLLTALFLGGFGNYLIPLMVGARDMVFPYVNMLSYWIYLLAVLVLVASFFAPGGPTGAGWTLYPPQAIMTGTPGGQDCGIILMLVSLILFIIGFTMGGLNYVVTVLQGRTRGMTLMRMPLTVWGIFTATVMALLAFPALFVACVMMLFDRLLGTSFFMPAIVEMGEQLQHGGGSPILFQHLFWFFGHPEVYIVALPAFGIVSDLISDACPQEHLRLPHDGVGDRRHRRALASSSGRTTCMSAACIPISASSSPPRR